jgi:hypothetical protein
MQNLVNAFEGTSLFTEQTYQRSIKKHLYYLSEEHRKGRKEMLILLAITP